jgi:hypothetical protein
MEWARLALEYLKVLLSTPVIIGIVCIWFICRFAASIRMVLERRDVKVKGPGGIEASFGGQAQAGVAEEVRRVQADTRLTPGAGALTVTGATPEVRVTGEQAPAAMPPEQVQRLQTIARWWMYERLYRAIFRSQIELLFFLARRPNGQARWNELTPFYEQAVPRGPAGAYPFENYLNYLRITSLVQWATPDSGQDTIVTLTVWGREFLQYLTGANYAWTVERPF